MEESFSCQGRTWTRRTIPGEPPVTVSGGTWIGTHILDDGETEMTVWQSTVFLNGGMSYIQEITNVPTSELNRVLSGMGYKLK